MIKKLLIGLLGLVSLGWGQTTVHSAGREVNNTFTGFNQFTLGVEAGPIIFANLGTISTSTTLIFISDATFGSSPCAGSGTGALAIRRNGIWDCSGGGNINAVTGTGIGNGLAIWNTSSSIKADAGISYLSSVSCGALSCDQLQIGVSGTGPFGNISVCGTSCVGITAGTISSFTTAIALPLSGGGGTFAVSASSPLVLNTSTGNLTCPTCVTGATGANQALSNLASVAVNLPLLPGADASIALDSTSLRYTNSWWSGVVGWADGAGNANVGLSSGGAGVINGGNGTSGDTTGTFQAAKFVAISGVAGVIGAGQGTAPSTIPGAIGHTAPTSVTAYNFMDPNASGNGVLSYSTSVNQTGCVASSTNLCGSFIVPPIKVASGTVAMPTGSLSASSCSSTTTTSATGALSTDTIAWSYNATPGATGLFVITSFATANNVNFIQCNPTNGSLTPAALTINWEVLR